MQLQACTGVVPTPVLSFLNVWISVKILYQLVSAVVFKAPA